MALVKIAPTVTVAVLIIVAMVTVKQCAYSAGRADERLLAKDDSLNAVIAASQLETAAREKGFQSARDSTSRVIASLRSRITLRDTAQSVVHNPPDSAVAPIAIGDPLLTDSAQTSLTDSLIHAYEKGRQQDSLEIAFWRMGISQRDSLISVLQKSRDVWRGRAQRRFSCTGGASVTAGLDGRVNWGPGITCGVKL